MVKAKGEGVFDWAERIEPGGTSPGVPDIHALIDGNEVWVELKRWPLVIRQSQAIWHGRWASLGKKSCVLAYNQRAKHGTSGMVLMLVICARQRLILCPLLLPLFRERAGPKRFVQQFWPYM